MKIANAPKFLGISKNGRATAQNRDQKLQKVAKQFEGLFLNYMLKTMRETVPKGGLFKEGVADDIYNSMFDSYLSEKASAAQSLGLAAMVYKQLSGRVTMKPEDVHVTNSIRSLENTVREPAYKKIDLPDRMKKIEPIIQEAADRFGVDADLIRSVIVNESAGVPEAVSNKGAKGLMQLMDGTAKELGVKNIWDPVENIFGGTRYLRKLLDRFGGDEVLAISSYNAGPGNVEKFGGVPPFKETRTYVKRVMQRYLAFKLQNKSI